MGGEVYKSDFKPGFVELSSIGIVACNNRWFDVGIQWLQQAFKNVPSNVDPKFLAETEGNYQKSLKLHDQYLETHGQISKNHRCFPTPFSKELKKKKKYKKAAAAEKKNS